MIRIRTSHHPVAAFLTLLALSPYILAAALGILIVYALAILVHAAVRAWQFICH
jgi:hypothetical protein